MNLNTLPNKELKKVLPPAKQKLEYQPTPTTRLRREEKEQRLQALRATIGVEQSENETPGSDRA